MTGFWRGKRSRVQILPQPPGAPLAPVELAEHTFVLEFPVVVSDRWSMTNFRRRREHRKLSLLLNVLLAGGVSRQPIQPKHMWAIEAAKGSGADALKWVQEFYFADIGEIVREDLSPPVTGRLEEVEPDAYYRSVGHDGRGLRVPADLDDSICRYSEISKSKVNREKFEIAAYWMDVASRQWTLSFSASFASLVIAIDALGERNSKPEVRFKDFIERYAPGASLESRRKAMYAQRNHILHGSGLMAFDQEAHCGWAPQEESGRELMEELWGLTRIAVRNCYAAVARMPRDLSVA